MLQICGCFHHDNPPVSIRSFNKIGGDHFLELHPNFYQYEKKTIQHEIFFI